MIKLIASDVDGTLVPDGTDRIDTRIYDIIKELKRHGITFAAASGRQFASLRRLFEPVKDDIYYITDNGGILRDINHVIKAYEMDHDMICEMINDAKKLPDCDIMLCGINKSYCADKGEMYEWMKYSYKFDIEAIGDLTQPVSDRIVKMSIYHNNNAENIVKEGFSPKWEKRIKIASAGIQWMDCTRPDSNKGTALKALMDILGIRKDETMAFGDNINDLDMLYCAEESYAIGGARQEVKDMAKHVADTRENQGVIKVMEEYLRELSN